VWQKHGVSPWSDKASEDLFHREIKNKIFAEAWNETNEMLRKERANGRGFKAVHDDDDAKTAEVLKLLIPSSTPPIHQRVDESDHPTSHHVDDPAPAESFAAKKSAHATGHLVEATAESFPFPYGVVQGPYDPRDHVDAQASQPSYAVDQTALGLPPAASLTVTQQIVSPVAQGSPAGIHAGARDGLNHPSEARDGLSAAGEVNAAAAQTPHGHFDASYPSYAVDQTALVRHLVSRPITQQLACPVVVQGGPTVGANSSRIHPMEARDE
jgi:hypothetical protein